MNKIYMLFACVISAVIIAGCSANKTPLFTNLSQDVKNENGVQLLGALKSIVAAPQNLKSTQKQLTPATFVIAMSSGKLLRSLDDSSGYSVFDKGSLTSPVSVDLKAVSSAEFGYNKAYPPAGTYKYFAMTLVYIEQVAPVNGWPTSGTHNWPYKLYFSTVGDARQWDITVNVGNGFQWVDTANNGSVTSTRPANPHRRELFNTTGDVTPSEAGYPKVYCLKLNPCVLAIPLEEDVTVPENPTGKWIGTMSFDITNGLQYEDHFGDSDAQQGNTADAFEPQYGDQGPNPMPPRITIKFTKQ